MIGLWWLISCVPLDEWETVLVLKLLYLILKHPNVQLGRVYPHLQEVIDLYHFFFILVLVEYCRQVSLPHFASIVQVCLRKCCISTMVRFIGNLQSCYLLRGHMDTCSWLQQVHSLIQGIVFLFGRWNGRKFIWSIEFRFILPSNIFINGVRCASTVTNCEYFWNIVKPLAADLNLTGFMRILTTPYHNISLIVPLLYRLPSEIIWLLLAPVDMLHQIVFVVSRNLRHLPFVSFHIVRVHWATAGTVDPNLFSNEARILKLWK